jgi:threonyl-tRNA synthetase
MSNKSSVVENEKGTALHTLRHSLSHIMALAVRQMRPNAKLAFGPPVENGFYYDFDFGDMPIGEGELEQIEQNMRTIIKARLPFVREEKSCDDALRYLEDQGEAYKVEYAKELIDLGKAAAGTLSFYTIGDFTDMCEGPHLEHTGLVPKNCFKLDRISGSYWRGDEKRPMLTRIYGLAFASGDELKEYIEMRKRAMERDHRKLGEELDLFIQDTEVGVGLPLWTPNGTVLRDELEKWAKETEFLGGYQRVSTPSVTRKELYLRSGHVPYYQDSMYPPCRWMRTTSITCGPCAAPTTTRFMRRACAVTAICPCACANTAMCSATKSTAPCRGCCGCAPCA